MTRSVPDPPAPTAVVPSGLVIAAARPEHAAQLEELQRVVFPTLADEGASRPATTSSTSGSSRRVRLVGLDGDRRRRHGDDPPALRLRPREPHLRRRHPGRLVTSHEADGDWLYGADIGVHPDYRGRGLAQALYAARQELVWRHGLKGQVTAGMMSGYGRVKDRMTAKEYYAGLVAGRINDPTLSMQQKVGFEFRGLLKDYLQDPVCDNYGVLIVLDAAKDVPGAVRPAGPRPH